MCNYVRYKLTLVLLCFSPPSPGSVSTPPPCDIVENPIEILDAAYLENAVCTANSLVEDNVNWWMKTCSGYITITNNIKGLLSWYNAGELHNTLCDMLKNLPDVSSPPPVPQLLMHIPFPKQKRKKQKVEVTPVDVYWELKSAYKHNAPCPENKGSVPLPENTDDMDISELEAYIVRCRDIVSEVDNMTLYNASNFGQWLNIAFGAFQSHKKCGKVLWPTFEMWLKDKCGISKLWATELRHFASLSQKYPQILFCRLSLSFFRKNRRHILSYFDSVPDIAEKWSHALTCSCSQCGPI